MKRGQYNKKYPNHFDFGASLRKPFGVSSFFRLLRQYKANAKRRGLKFFLSEEQFKKLTSKSCFYCGALPEQKIQNKDANGPYWYNGIDRKNPLIGYIRSNCVSACKICNRAKSKLDFKEWNRYLKRIAAYKESNRKPKGEYGRY
jgi:hypothetical protein